MTVQPFHRVTFEWKEALSLEIEWSGGRAGIPIPLLSPPLATLKESISELQLDAIGRAGVPPICWRETEDVLFEPLQLREATSYLLDISVPCTFEEAEQHALATSTWPLSPDLTKYFRRDPPKRWKRVKGGVRITGLLNFGSYIGVSDLGLPDFGTGAVRFEIACAKLGYFDDLKNLLNHIAEEAVDLIFSIEAPTFAPLGMDDLSEADPLALLFNFRRVMADGGLANALETILRSPHNVIHIQEEVKPIVAVTHPALDLIAAQLSSQHFMTGGPLADLFHGYTPTHLPERLIEETVDTPENRFVKAFLLRMEALAEELATRLEIARKSRSSQEVRQWSGLLQDVLSEPLWRDVGPLRHLPSNSQILQRREGYKDILAADLSFQLGLRLPWKRGIEIADGLDGQLRPISELYEYWCFFILRTCLRKICGSEIYSDSLLEQGIGGFGLNLRRGLQSKVQFNYISPLGETADVLLYYNKQFQPKKITSSIWEDSYSAIFHPDYSVLVKFRNQEEHVKHWIHFDAKYKLDFLKWEEVFTNTTTSIEEDIVLSGMPLDDERRETYKRSDLYKMHTYRDAVLGTRGSYILFPGRGEQENLFIRQPGERYPTSDYFFPGVGAFQLRPAQDEVQKNQLESFMSKILEQLSHPKSYQEEKGYF